MITMPRVYQWCSATLLAGLFLSVSEGWQGSLGENALCITACCLLFLFLSGIQSAQKKGYAALFLLTAGILLFWVFRSGTESVLSFLRTFFLWAFGEKNTPDGQPLSFRLLLALLLSACAFFSQGLLEHAPKLKPAAVLLLSAWLGFCMVRGIRLSRAGTVFAFVYLLLSLLQFVQNRWRREHKHPVKNHIIWLLPFLAAYLTLLFFLPFPDKPYDWQWVKQAYKNIRESVITLTWSLPFGSREDYAPSYTGFSQDASLPGSINRQTEELMLLETNTRLYTNLYLTGETYDRFTGRQWEQTAYPPAFDRLLDPLLTAHACQTLREPYTTDYMLRATLSVRYLKFRTSYLFAPSKALIVTQGQETMDMSQKDRWRFESLQSYGTQYAVDFYQLNAGQERFWDFCMDATAPSDAEWEQILREYHRINGQRLSLQDVREYENAVETLYGQPPVLSTPVQKWLEEVTEGCNTDVQKLLALKQALSACSYQTSPGELPDNVTDAASFLEYLLLESREGYCAHYASAFVLLSRALGIPARYVQGYLVPTKGKTQAVVTSDMGHAWPEAYITGIGWISFEPTPGYAARFDASWQMRQTFSESHPEMYSASGEATSYETPLPQETAPAFDATLSGEDPEDAAKNAALWQMLRLLRLLILPTLLLLAALWLLERWALFVRYRKQPAGKQLHILAEYAMKCLAALRCRRRESETLQEFSYRAAAQLGTDTPLALFSLYERLLYGTGDFAPAEIAAAKEAVNGLLHMLRSQSRIRYLFLWLQKPFPATTDQRRHT